MARANDADAKAHMAPPYPVTPDGRYFVVRGPLWRAINRNLLAGDWQRLVAELMDARRAVGRARRAGDDVAVRAARQRVHTAEAALGERGPVWCDDGTPDYNRRLARNTSYATWYRSVGRGSE